MIKFKAPRTPTPLTNPIIPAKKNIFSPALAKEKPLLTDAPKTIAPISGTATMPNAFVSKNEPDDSQSPPNKIDGTAKEAQFAAFQASVAAMNRANIASSANGNTTGKRGKYNRQYFCAFSKGSYLRLSLCRILQKLTAIRIPQMKSDGKRCLFVRFSFKSHRKFVSVFRRNVNAEFCIFAFNEFSAGKQCSVIGFTCDRLKRFIFIQRHFRRKLIHHKSKELLYINCFLICAG